MRIVLSAPNTLGYPDGGHVWVFINWALGFRSLGHEVVWLDVTHDKDTPETVAALLSEMRSRLAPFGLDEQIALCTEAGDAYAHEADVGLYPLEQALTGEGVFTSTAKALESGAALEIPTDVFQRFCERRPDMWRLVVQHTIDRLAALERKVEHLCHSDVRSRLIFYLDELARLGQTADANGASLIHISQNEMASLVGATRETTSTTLNALAREGLISLGHRLVMIPSLEALRNAGPSGSARTTAAGQGQPQL